MGYSLYITDNCHACTVVMEYIRKNELSIEVYPTDRRDRPHEAFEFPALFKDERLIGYGDEDIVRHFEKQQKTA
jgi:hypothetical protein